MTPSQEKIALFAALVAAFAVVVAVIAALEITTRDMRGAKVNYETARNICIHAQGDEGLEAVMQCIVKLRGEL